MNGIKIAICMNGIKIAICSHAAVDSTECAIATYNEQVISLIAIKTNFSGKRYSRQKCTILQIL